MSLIERIDAARERWNVLEHPFYTRWSCGELTRDELAHYAGEYRHAVVALADTATKTGHAEHAREEAEHVDALGRVRRRLRRRDGSRAELPRRPSAWPPGPLRQNRREALAVMYAIEAGQPAVSQTKLDGLAEHYGVAVRRAGRRVLRAALRARPRACRRVAPRARARPRRPTTTASSRLPKRRCGVTGRCWTESKPGGKPMKLFLRGLAGAPAPPAADRTSTIGAYTFATAMAVLSRLGVSEHNTATAWWLALARRARRHACRRRSPASPTGSTSRVARRSGGPRRSI